MKQKIDQSLQAMQSLDLKNCELSSVIEEKDEGRATANNFREETTKN